MNYTLYDMEICMFYKNYINYDYKKKKISYKQTKRLKIKY